MVRKTTSTATAYTIASHRKRKYPHSLWKLYTIFYFMIIKGSPKMCVTWNAFNVCGRMVDGWFAQTWRWEEHLKHCASGDSSFERMAKVSNPFIHFMSYQISFFKRMPSSSPSPASFSSSLSLKMYSTLSDERFCLVALCMCESLQKALHPLIHLNLCSS